MVPRYTKRPGYEAMQTIFILFSKHLSRERVEHFLLKRTIFIKTLPQNMQE